MEKNDKYIKQLNKDCLRLQQEIYRQRILFYADRALLLCFISAIGEIIGVFYGHGFAEAGFIMNVIAAFYLMPCLYKIWQFKAIDKKLKDDEA